MTKQEYTPELTFTEPEFEDARQLFDLGVFQMTWETDNWSANLGLRRTRQALDSTSPSEMKHTHLILIL